MEIVRIDGFWNLVQPVAARADPHLADQILALLTHLPQAALVESSKSTANRYGFIPGESPRVIYRRGKTSLLELEVGYEEQNWTYLRQPPDGPVFAWPGRVGGLFKRKVSEYRDRTIFRADAREIELVTVQNQRGSFTLRRDTQTGSLDPVGIKIANFNRFRAEQFVSVLCGLRAKDFARPPVERSAVGLSEGADEIVLQHREENRVRTVTIKLGKTDDRQRATYLSTSGSDDIYLISRHIAAFLRPAAIDFSRTDAEVVADEKARQFARQHAAEHRKGREQNEPPMAVPEEWGKYVAGQKIPDQVLEILRSMAESSPSGQSETQ